MKAVGISTLVLRVEPADIALLKAILESYDNLLTLRTEDPARSYLRIWFDPASETDVRELLGCLAGQIRLRIVDQG